MTADEWNTKWPVGTLVRYYPFRRADGRLEPEGSVVAHTRSKAWTLGHGAPVVKIEGKAGGVSLDHLDVLTCECDAPDGTCEGCDDDHGHTCMACDEEWCQECWEGSAHAEFCPVEGRNEQAGWEA